MKIDKFESFANILLREIILYLACIVIFPLKSIRIIAYKWHIWIQKWDSRIKKDHEEFFEKYY